jgi:hypothetical protein
MSLEDKIDALIEALNENTAALKGGGGGGGKAESTESTSTKTSSGKGGKAGGKAGATKYDVQQVKAMAVKIKDQFGTPAAKKLIKEKGKADALADIAEENFAAFMQAGQKMIDDAENGGGEGSDEEGSGL